MTVLYRKEKGSQWCWGEQGCLYTRQTMEAKVELLTTEKEKVFNQAGSEVSKEVNRPPPRARGGDA